MTSALTVTSREFEMEWALAHRGRCAESITAALRAACVERPGLFSSPLPREQQWTYMNDLKELWLYPPAVATSSGEAKLETKANATEKRTRKCWSTRGSGSSIIKLEGGETSASTPSLAIFLLLPLLFPFHCSAMWRKSDKKLNITIQNSFQMFVLHPSVIFVYVAKLCVLAVKSGGVYKTDTSQGWNCNATLTCFLIRGGEILIYFIFLFLHFFSAACHRLEWFEEGSGQNLPNTRSIWGELFILSFRHTHTKKNCSCKVADPRGGRVEWPAKSNFSVCVFTRVAIAGGKCIVSAPGSSLCYGSSVTHYSVALCTAAKKNKESQDYLMAHWEITHFTPGSCITADYRARWKVVLNNGDIQQSECLFSDTPGKQLLEN